MVDAQKERLRVQKTAVAIALVGFVFAFLTVPFAGIDLLIDAVGYLLVFNGLHGLVKLHGTGALRAARAVAAILIAVCAVQLFFTGTVAGALALVRHLAEAILFGCMAPGFYRVLKNQQQPGGAVACAIALGLCVLAALAAAVIDLFTLAGSPFAPQATSFIEGAGLVVHLGLLVVLLVVFKIYKRDRQA